MDYGQLVSVLDEMGLGGDADQDQARIDALRKQQMIGAMGGVMDVPGTQKMGQAMFEQASDQIGELQSPDRPLARALTQAKVVEALGNLGPEQKAQWNVVSDGVGGFMKVNKYTGEVQPMAGMGMQAAMDSGVPFDPDAPVDPITGKMTGDQDKSRLYASMGAPGLAGMFQQVSKGYEPSLAGKLLYETGGFGIKGTAALAAASEPDRTFVRDAKDVLAAILRKESGAAITESEWASGAQRFVPMPWDGEETKKAKMIAAYRALREIGLGAGPGAKRALSIVEHYGRPVFDHYAGDGVIDLGD